MKLTTGYKKPIASSGTDAQEQSSNNSYLLLAGGGHKALSDFATAGHTHSDYVSALGTSDIYLTWTKNGNTSNIIVPYAESAGNAGTLGGYHESAFSKNGHTHTTSEITNFQK